MTSKLLGEYFPQDLMKLTCRQWKLVIERKFQLFCKQRNLVSIKSKQNENHNTDENSALEVNISLDMANLNMINISSLDFHVWQHLEKHQNESQLQHLASIHSVPVELTLQTHGQWHSTYSTLPITWRVNRRYSINLDTVFSHRSLCNSYRIAYTSRIRDLLLLFLLVSTCQISMLTFTTRYHAIYNCGWWCRGNTHLQMQWQGPTASKTSWESWPVYGAYTYMDGELI